MGRTRTVREKKEMEQIPLRCLVGRCQAQSLTPPHPTASSQHAAFTVKAAFRTSGSGGPDSCRSEAAALHRPRPAAEPEDSAA